MTKEMKSFLLAQLQLAIDEAVAESASIGAIVDEMKRSGYDLSLMLETTITISPTEDSQPDTVPEPRLTAEDLAFLQELNIAV